MTTLIVDESGDDVGLSHRYVIGAGVLFTADDELPALRDDIRAAVNAGPTRRRPFHWVSEGPQMRGTVLGLIGRLPIEIYAVIGATDSRHHLELTRDRCLRELFRSDMRWLTQLGERVRTTLIRLPSERA